MEKSKLEKFITKYNLGGSCESVIFNSDGDTLTVRCISDDKNVLGEVSVENISFPKGEFAVYDTKKLKAMLSVLDENLTVKANVKEKKTTGLDMTDGNTKVTFVLADPSVVPNVPTVDKVPAMDFAITLDEKFINTFIRAKSALNDVETFTVTSEGIDNTASVVIGQSSNNTNRIVVTANTDKKVKLDPISFSTNYFREILNANKDITNGTLEVSSKGLSIVRFVANGFTSVYYLVRITI